MLPTVHSYRVGVPVSVRVVGSVLMLMPFCSRETWTETPFIVLSMTPLLVLNTTYRTVVEPDCGTPKGGSILTVSVAFDPPPLVFKLPEQIQSIGVAAGGATVSASGGV